jgi:hypothetical protein
MTTFKEMLNQCEGKGVLRRVLKMILPGARLLPPDLREYASGLSAKKFSRMLCPPYSGSICPEFMNCAG